jgi:hypothetical protein
VQVTVWQSQGDPLRLYPESVVWVPPGSSPHTLLASRAGGQTLVFGNNMSPPYFSSGAASAVSAVSFTTDGTFGACCAILHTV